MKKSPPPAPPPALLEPRVRMAHFLRRAGFGHAPGEIDTRLNDGYETTVRTFVESGSVPDGLGDVDQHIGDIFDFNAIEDVRTWWIYRMIHSQRPLVEKMAFFWHGHFATAVSKVDRPYLMYQQNQLFREKGLGTFSDLLRHVAQDPAMLIWLDGATNRKGHPNENFAREVMELFTVGTGVYTERDVLEAARAFTGWGLKDDKFVFSAGDHDFGKKAFLGHEGDLDGSDVLEILAAHPATAQRMVGKLFAFFAYDDPSPETIAPFVEVWKASGGNVREVLRAIFLSPAFSSPAAYRAKVKSPAEFVIGTIRSLGGTITPRQTAALMARMGQDLFNPPSVKGWDGGRAWISTSALFERFNFAASITTARGPAGTSHIDPITVFDGVTPTTARQMIEAAARHLLDGQMPDKTKDVLQTYITTPDPQAKEAKDKPAGFALDARTLDEKVRGMLHLLLSTPEYQLS
jgi:uncharacterized protein (DUF1800 family)